LPILRGDEPEYLKTEEYPDVHELLDIVVGGAAAVPPAVAKPVRREVLQLVKKCKDVDERNAVLLVFYMRLAAAQRNGTSLTDGAIEKLMAQCRESVAKELERGSGKRAENTENGFELLQGQIEELPVASQAKATRVLREWSKTLKDAQGHRDKLRAELSTTIREIVASKIVETERHTDADVRRHARKQLGALLDLVTDEIIAAPRVVVAAVNTVLEADVRTSNLTDIHASKLYARIVVLQVLFLDQSPSETGVSEKELRRLMKRILDRIRENGIPAEKKLSLVDFLKLRKSILLEIADHSPRTKKTLDAADTKK
jgi:hypothetical protein